MSRQVTIITMKLVHLFIGLCLVSTTVVQVQGVVPLLAAGLGLLALKTIILGAALNGGPSNNYFHNDRYYTFNDFDGNGMNGIRGRPVNQEGQGVLNQVLNSGLNPTSNQGLNQGVSGNLQDILGLSGLQNLQNGLQSNSGAGRFFYKRSVNENEKKPLEYHIPKELIFAADFQDVDDCAKKLICELNAKNDSALDGIEVLIKSLFGYEKSGQLDVTKPSARFDFAAIVGLKSGFEQCKTLFSRCDSSYDAMKNIIEEGLVSQEKSLKTATAKTTTKRIKDETH